MKVDLIVPENLKDGLCHWMGHSERGGRLKAVYTVPDNCPEKAVILIPTCEKCLPFVKDNGDIRKI